MLASDQELEEAGNRLGERLLTTGRTVVREMVAGALVATDADVAVAISGVAGPGGGSDDKPVGTVWFAWGSSPASTVAVVKHFEGDRDQVRRQAVLFALQGVNNFVDEV